jgi:tripartite ATP-independent transporter DctM subunit
MPSAGLLMLLAAGLLMLVSGLPAYAVLLLVSGAAATLGVAAGVLDLSLLGAMPSRVVGLLEQDLLQAVPLFVLVGALLDQLPLADLLYRCACRLAGRGPAAPRLGALALGSLLAPMNGSVGASVSLLSRVVAPRLQAQGVDAADRVALVSVGSTLGVLVPPSLVLLMLGDALMRAHTEALNAAGRAARIVNTQDLLHGAVLPALIGVGLMLAVAAWQGRRAAAPPPAVAAVAPREWALAAFTLAVLLGLLAGVAAGVFYAVEAAATGGLLLFAGGLLARQLDAARLRAVLHETLALSGSLLALFVAATTFTLLLRAFGTDRWIAQAFAAASPGPQGTLAIGLVAMLLCGLVLDAFELVLVVVPVLMPVLLVRVDDAVWAGVLVLLALQTSFLLPPLGYAVMMAAGRVPGDPPRARALVRALAPYLVAQCLLLALLLAWPRLVHLLEPAAAPAAPALSNDEVERLLQGMPAREAPR